jgi:hypothetical protein
MLRFVSDDDDDYDDVREESEGLSIRQLVIIIDPSMPTRATAGRETKG